MTEGAVEEGTHRASMLRTRLFWACVVTLGLGIYLFAPIVFPPSHSTLRDESEEFFFQVNQAAGAPVLVLSLWLFYRRSHYRDVFRGPGATGAACIAFLATLGLFGWGVYTKAPDLQLASLIGLLVGSVLLVAGKAGLRAYWLPILFIAFALPVSPVLIAATIYPIQLVTAQIAGLTLNGFGFDAVVFGDQILRPEGTFVVIESCSGLRTIVTLSMLTVLLIDLFERRGWHAFALIALAPVIAFAVNGLRVVTLVLNPHSSIQSVHSLQGIAMLLVGLTTLYLIDGRLESWLGHRDPNAENGDYGMTRSGDNYDSNARRVLKMVGVALLIVALIALDRFVPPWKSGQRLEEQPAALLTRVFGEDHGPRLQMDYRFVGSVLYLAHARHRVLIDGATVEVFLGVANEQRREFSVLTKRLAWPASGYAPVDESFVEMADPGPLARRMIFERGARKVMTYSWISRRESLPAEFLRQAAALDRSMFVRPGHMLSIRIVTGISPDDPAGFEEAEIRIRKAWARLADDLESYATNDTMRSLGL